MASAKPSIVPTGNPEADLIQMGVQLGTHAIDKKEGESKLVDTFADEQSKNLGFIRSSLKNVFGTAVMLFFALIAIILLAIGFSKIGSGSTSAVVGLLVTGFLLAGVSGFLGYQVYFRKSKGE
jgi:hypothetical protein